MTVVELGHSEPGTALYPSVLNDWVFDVSEQSTDTGPIAACITAVGPSSLTF